MGWFHLTQLLEDPSAKMCAVVEPWFLGEGKSAPGCPTFNSFRQAAEASTPGLLFLAAVQDLPQFDPAVEPTLALIAVRTKDAPSIFEAVCAKGVTHVIVEKPGAESAEQLQAMRDLAAAKGIQVVLGYNKNVSGYVRNALAALGLCGSVPPITLEHNNDFVEGSEELDTYLRGSGGEGMLHNMCCHELAIAVVTLGLRCESIDSVTLDPDRSKLIVLKDGRRDWLHLSFSVTLRGEPMEPWKPAIQELRFVSNRCGGNFSCVHLERGNEGLKRQSFRLPAPEHEAEIQREQAKDREIRSYIILQASAYRELKGTFLDHIIAGKSGTPPALTDLNAAIEVLNLADLLKPVLLEIFEGGAPWRWTASAVGKKRKRPLDPLPAERCC